MEDQVHKEVAEEAIQNALRQLLSRCEKQISHCFPSLKPALDSYKMAKTTQVKQTVTVYMCDDCHTHIFKETEGVVVVGNIYDASVEAPGGLIGDNFPDQPCFGVKDVRKTVLCNVCFAKAIRRKV